MRAQLRGAALGQLRGAELELAPGRYVVLANEREPLSSLVAVVAGREPPRHGQVRLDGAAPASSPATRRKIAALFQEEALPPARTVLAGVARALLARGEAEHAAAQLLTDAGLSTLANRLPSALGQVEARSIALALALAHATAELVALHEPLTTLVPTAFVLARLDAHTARGAIVITTTTSAADATLLGGRWLSVELGRLRAGDTSAPRLGAGPWQQVLVQSKDARALAQLLLDSPHGLAAELGAAPDSLRIMGPALDVTVQELIAVARQHDLEIRSIEAAVPPVEALLAARAGFARGAYEASRAEFATAPAHGPARASGEVGTP